jgi:hypothetical protein
MVDESSSNAPTAGTAITPPSPVAPRYDWLRWAIRITGIVLMFGGTIYIGLTAAKLLTDNKSDSVLLMIVVSLITLGLGIFVLRIGMNMLRSINVRTIGSFSFVFALIYTYILTQILPLSGFFNDSAVLVYLLVFLYFGLSYWILKSILILLLLPPHER